MWYRLPSDKPSMMFDTVLWCESHCERVVMHCVSHTVRLVLRVVGRNVTEW